jgi:hypothetical protein
MLSFAHSVDAEDAVDAIYKAIAKIVGTHPDIIRYRVAVSLWEPPDMYVVVDRMTLSSVLARVESPRQIGFMVPHPYDRIVDRMFNQSHHIVTFYPHTYKPGTILLLYRGAVELRRNRDSYEGINEELYRKIKDKVSHKIVLRDVNGKKVIAVETEFGEYIVDAEDLEDVIYFQIRERVREEEKRNESRVRRRVKA